MKTSKYMQVLSGSVASGMSVKDASVIAGCTESTAYSISCSDEFRHEVNRLRTQAMEQAVGVLTNAATKAAQSLVKLLDSEDEKIVLAASSKLLGILPGMQELAELRARIDAIENGPVLRIAK